MNVQGATLADASYSFDTTGANITGVTLTFTGDLTGNDIEASFGTDALSGRACGAGRRRRASG